MDSGTGTMATMATVSTVTGRYSRTSPTCNGKQLNGINTTSEGSSVDHLSDVWPRHSTHHPPSPPVRQRARYQPFSFYFSFFFFLSFFICLFIYSFIYIHVQQELFKVVQNYKKKTQSFRNSSEIFGKSKVGKLLEAFEKC